MHHTCLIDQIEILTFEATSDNISEKLNTGCETNFYPRQYIDRASYCQRESIPAVTNQPV